MRGFLLVARCRFVRPTDRCTAVSTIPSMTRRYLLHPILTKLSALSLFRRARGARFCGETLWVTLAKWHEAAGTPKALLVQFGRPISLFGCGSSIPSLTQPTSPSATPGPVCNFALRWANLASIHKWACVTADREIRPALVNSRSHLNPESFVHPLARPVQPRHNLPPVHSNGDRVNRLDMVSRKPFVSRHTAIKSPF